MGKQCRNRYFNYNKHDWQHLEIKRS